METNNIALNNGTNHCFVNVYNSKSDIETNDQQQTRADNKNLHECPYQKNPDGFYMTTPQGESFRLTNFTARITCDIIKDDGIEQHRFYEIETALDGRVSQFLIAAKDFRKSGWIDQNIGSEAVLFADVPKGYAHLRTAIQVTSKSVPKKWVYGHLGWCKRDGCPFYLHGGGAIDAHGEVPGIQTALPEGQPFQHVP